MPEEVKEFQIEQTVDLLETYLMRTILPYYENEAPNVSDEGIYKDFTESKVNTIKLGLFDDYTLVREVFNRTVKRFRDDF